ncbi:phage major capsid protein [Rhizobium sp. NFR03]|uniref:phage major capsid protein n=2 Tax=unclassified Rhizobium TaxID=2613769 RepID=UPI0008BE799A|nr:phage major capsid protein [Rhizobium sp. NFR03]SER57864.1 phage major capsid protein, HK97 family [Rhizobium sp. NFR03]
MTIKVLRQKRADLVKEAQSAFDLAASENRGLTDQEATRDDAISAELTALDDQIVRAERQMERQRSVGSVIDPNENADRNNAQGREGARFSSLGEQMLAIAGAANPDRRGNADPRLIFAGPTGMSEGVAADGGFLVQTDFSNELLQNTYEGGEIASRVRRIPIGPNSNGIHMNGVDETSRANGSRWGGIQSFWTAEAGLKRDSTPKFRRIKMELDKLTGLCYATDELLQDSTALESWLRQAFADEFLFKIEDAIINGTGAGMPLGFLNGGSMITVPKEAGQLAGTIVAENILKMWARMPARSRKNAVWVINQDVEPQLYQFVIKVKNAAGTENVGGIAAPAIMFTPPGANGSQYATLMGRPIIPVEYAATLGTAGDIMLVDLSQYLAIDKGPTQFASSIHVRFIYDETCFRFVYRFNGQPIWSNPMTPYKGTATQSPFITLETRA